MSDDQNHAPSQAPSRGPEDTLREGPLKATIWRNEGENGAYRTTEYTRSYQDKDGKWHDTHAMRESDNLPLRHLSGRAHDRVMALKIAEREHRKTKTPEQSKDMSPQR
jgi:hypothetical protein